MKEKGGRRRNAGGMKEEKGGGMQEECRRKKGGGRKEEGRRKEERRILRPIYCNEKASLNAHEEQTFLAGTFVFVWYYNSGVNELY
jgi:hypothetical protein